MKKLESSLANMMLVLTGVTVVCVAILAYVNKLTQETIAEANAKALNTALKEVLPAYANDPVAECDTIFAEKKGKKVPDYILYPAKDASGALVGCAVESHSQGFGGELKVLVGFDREGKVFNYSLLAHTETPGLGSKADTWFGAYSQSAGEKPVTHAEDNQSIIGMAPGEKPLTVSKDGGEVDGITASTITSRAFLKAVNQAYAIYASAQKKADKPGVTSVDQVSGATEKADTIVTNKR